MTDDTLMPFGKHKGTPMQDVPAAYLLWLWDNGIFSEKGKPLHGYIFDNFTVLESEAKDYIVQHKPAK